MLLTNKNHALEEHHLAHVAFGIAEIITGNHREPLHYPATRAPFILPGILFISGILSVIWWYYNRKNKPLLNKRIWMIISILLLGISTGLIPLFVYIIGIPWHTLWLFIPDISFTLVLLSLLFLANALLALRYYYLYIPDQDPALQPAEH